MPINIQLLPVTDFTGGLNYRANAVQLRGSESPDMLNVDLDPRGGVKMRNVVTPYQTAALGAQILSLWTFSASNGTNHVMVSRGNSTMSYSAGGAFTDIVLAPHTAVNAIHRATTFKDQCYIENGTNKAVRWTTAAAATELTDPAVAATWVADFATAENANMPIGKFITSHAGSVWVANTLENGTAFINRIRWSHPNKPEAWRAQDFVDIDLGRDGDQITGIMPFHDKLLVFKAHSTHVITGYAPSNFQETMIDPDHGACVQEAICRSEDAVYFFSWPDGVMRYRSGTGSDWLWERIYPKVLDGTILSTRQSDIRLGWLNRRLWVSLTETSGSANNRQYVFDPTLGHTRIKTGTLTEGGWTKYNLPLGSMVAMTPAGSAHQWLAIGQSGASVGRILKLEQTGDQDTYDGTNFLNISSYYATKWFDAGAPAVIKRWKRPEFLFQHFSPITLDVNVYIDYNPQMAMRNFSLEMLEVMGAGGTWDDAGLGVWDTMVWGGDGGQPEMIQKGSLLGRARSVQMIVSGPSPSVRWAIDGFTLKYVPLRVRA